LRHVCVTPRCSAPLVLHWNGGGWSKIPLPSPNSTENFSNGVTALAANNAWAVGQSGLQSFILHWNGAQWGRVKSPNVTAPGGYGEINTLRSIAGSTANDLWAVGSADKFLIDSMPDSATWQPRLIGR